MRELHAEQSGVPRNWIHVVFQEYRPGFGFTSGESSETAALTVVIRFGRPPEYKQLLLTHIWKLFQAATGAADEQIVIGIQAVSASQAMEMAQFMPGVSDRQGRD